MFNLAYKNLKELSNNCFSFSQNITMQEVLILGMNKHTTIVYNYDGICSVLKGIVLNVHIFQM